MPDTLLFSYLILPLIIILARISDVSLGTLRIILFTKGLKKLAPVVGFFEAFIWIMVVKQILTSVPGLVDFKSFIAYVAYSLGYALGTYVGIVFDKKLSLGNVLIRVIVSKDCDKLELTLRENNFGVTTVDARGKEGEVSILFIVIHRTELDSVIRLIQENNPSAFFTIENVQAVNAGYFTGYGKQSAFDKFNQMFLPVRKSK